EAPAGHKLRVVVLEDELEAAVAIAGRPDARVPPRDALLARMGARAAGRPGRKDGILVHDVAQRDLRSQRPWPVKHAGRDTASAVVRCLEAALARAGGPVRRLAEDWVVASGIETGADYYSPRLRRKLDPALRGTLSARGLHEGAPIMQLPPGAESEPPWCDHPQFLARAPEAGAILYAAIDAGDSTNLVWIERGQPVPDAVIGALEPWREVLAGRAEFRRNARRAWWETAWPRNRADLLAPKVVAVHRTDRGRFALDERGEWQAAKNATTVVARGGESVAYLCGLLNSELLDLWYALRGRTPRDVWRDYEPKPMNELPYRRVPTPAGWTPGPEVERLERALAAGDAGAAGAAADAVRAGIGAPAGDADARTAIEQLVRALADNRRALLPLRSTAPELRRAVKTPWRTQGVTVAPAGVLAELPEAELRSIRLDPALGVELATDGVLGRAALEAGLDGGVLRFRHRRTITATVAGPQARLELLLQTLPADGRLTGEQLRAARVPFDLDAFERTVARRQAELQRLLDDGRALVESVERLVCALYGVPDALTERVVASAVARAATTAADDG
ncbi:MAG TPA: hypothetical protein VF250_16595, partial [Conexibacter sp.]